MWLSQSSACPACWQLWVPSPGPHELSIGLHALQYQVLGRWRQKELEVQGHPQLGGEFEVSPSQALAQKQTKLEEQMYKINSTIEFF